MPGVRFEGVAVKARVDIRKEPAACRFFDKCIDAIRTTPPKRLEATGRYTKPYAPKGGKAATHIVFKLRVEHSPPLDSLNSLEIVIYEITFT